MILTDLAKYLAIDGRQEEAMAQIERASDLAENQADASVTLSFATALVAGDGARALALVDRALELNPDPPGWYRYYECRATFFAGCYKRCLAVATSAGGFMTAYVYGALAAIELGREDTARGFHADLIRLYPGFGFREYAAPIVHPGARRQFMASVARLEAALARNA